MSVDRRVAKKIDDIIIYRKSVLYPLDHKIWKMLTIGSNFFFLLKNDDFIGGQNHVCYYIKIDFIGGQNHVCYYI